MQFPKGKHAWMVKIGEKGQFVIPKEARDQFGLQPGQTILVLADDEKGIAIPPRDVSEKLFAQIFQDSEQEE
ncbi:AbrB/MazE/SpoVT family DNA-binding domain-containing protein [bacterium]|nr:AbrB/MazE/SpoVT family DNA-binding domain-containing protein [bacterium]MDY4582431.1 AbrB/MazE/SpoVT family DNA-binding domain-containing protein [Candidatus Faecousia sp.]